MTAAPELLLFWDWIHGELWAVMYRQNNKPWTSSVLVMDAEAPEEQARQIEDYPRVKKTTWIVTGGSFRCQLMNDLSREIIIAKLHEHK
eukprot:7964154-Pyramimonas_sp.AAC.1